MTSKLIHLNNSTPGIVPATTELTLGQIAINNADAKIFILTADGTIATFTAGGGGAGTVTSVNTVLPDDSGNVTLTATELGASTLGATLFAAVSEGAARTALGSTSVGDALFVASNEAVAQSVLGATAVGSALLTATDAPTAVSALGATSVGAAVFDAANTAAAQTAIGVTATGSSIVTATSVSAVVTLLSVIPTSQIGANSGVAGLDSSGKILTANLPGSILGGVNYQGSFIPGTSTLPAAASSNKGWYYVTTAAGSYTPPGGALLTFASGDWLISDSSEWTVLDAQDAVSSVNGKTGAVVIAATDIDTGTFAAAQLGASSGDNDVLTTNGSGAPIWVSQVPTLNLGASVADSTVLTINGSGVSTWVSLIPNTNLPVATAASLGIAQAGSGLSVAAGVLSVNTAALVLDEGTYVGS
jgi:hypothetical protein